MEELDRIISEMGYENINEFRSQIKDRIINNFKRAPGSIKIEKMIDIIQDSFVFFNGECPLSSEKLNKDNWHLDHVIPVILGGYSEPWNLLPLCDDCNLKKSSKYLLDFIEQEGVDPKKVEKVFIYLINQLEINDYKINNNLEIGEEQEQLSMDELSDDDLSLLICNKKVDSITFLFHLFKYLENNSEFIVEDSNLYKEKLEKIIHLNNQKIEVLEEQYARQNEIKDFLKELGVHNYYSISYNLFDEIKDLTYTKSNIETIDNYFQDFNIGYLINKNPMILLMSFDDFKNRYEYLLNEVGMSKDVIINKPILLNKTNKVKELYELCANVGYDFNSITDYAFLRGDVSKFINILASEEFKNNPDLFSSTVLAFGNLEEIQKMLQSEEFKNNRKLFSSDVLAHGNLEKIQKILQSEEFKNNPDLFSSTVLSRGNLEEIQKMLQSEELKNNSDLFSSYVLGRGNLEKIQKMLQSEEFKNNSDLFSSDVLAHGNLEKIQKMLQSEEFKNNRDLFSSGVLARGNLEKIQKMLQSEEFKNNRKLFSSGVLAHGNLEEIKKILQSEEFRNNRKLFSSSVLAYAKLDDIQKLLKMDCWNDERYSNLLTSSVVANSKSMLSKLPLIFKIAEDNNIDNFLYTRFLINAPAHNYALIEYLKDNGLPLVIDDKLNPIFSKQPGVLKKKYNLDINELIKKYPYEEDNKKINGGKSR